MLQLLYILAFTFLAFVAVGNLIRNLISFGQEAQKPLQPMPQSKPQITPHPEMFDEAGKVVQEPLLVMRSIGLDDMRDRLDAIYKSSPGQNRSEDDEQPPAASV